MYIATAFIGTDYTPGEILPDDLDEALVKRLLKSGAIRETAPEPVAPRPARAEAEPPAQEEPEEPEDETDEEAEEPYEEPEAPEVDAAEALIAPAEEEAKPAPRKRTAKGGRGK